MCVFGCCPRHVCSCVVEDHVNLSVFWEAVVMGLIGESLDEGDNITGARVIDKSNTGSNQVSHRIEIWFRDWDNESFKTSIEKTIRDLMKECGCVSTDVSLDKNDSKKYACTALFNTHSLNLHFFSVRGRVASRGGES